MPESQAVDETGIIMVAALADESQEKHHNSKYRDRGYGSTCARQPFHQRVFHEVIYHHKVYDEYSHYGYIHRPSGHAYGAGEKQLKKEACQ